MFDPYGYDSYGYDDYYYDDYSGYDYYGGDMGYMPAPRPMAFGRARAMAAAVCDRFVPPVMINFFYICRMFLQEIT